MADAGSWEKNTKMHEPKMKNAYNIFGNVSGLGSERKRWQMF